MKRTFYLKRETDGARLVETLLPAGGTGFEFWIPRSVCPTTLKYPPNAEGRRLVLMEIEDWWWEKNGVEAKEQAQGQGRLL